MVWLDAWIIGAPLTLARRSAARRAMAGRYDYSDSRELPRAQQHPSKQKTVHDQNLRGLQESPCATWASQVCYSNGTEPTNPAHQIFWKCHVLFDPDPAAPA